MVRVCGEGGWLGRCGRDLYCPSKLTEGNDITSGGKRDFLKGSGSGEKEEEGLRSWESSFKLSMG